MGFNQMGHLVMTLTLGSRPKQMHGKVWAENAIWESHTHSQECEGVSPHIPKWIPTLEVGETYFKSGLRGQNSLV
jgi:hypothetical protein